MAALRIQLCGTLAVERAGERLERSLPGRRGRMLLGYLVVHRDRPHSRDALIDAIWRDDVPDGDVLTPLLSKLRRVLGSDSIQGRSDIRFVAERDTLIDVETAIASLHHAEHFALIGDWVSAWSPAHVAHQIAKRPFLLGLEASWIDEWRRSLEEIRRRALGLYAQSSLGIGGHTLGAAERAARLLIDTSPFDETGYRILMEVLEKQDNKAAALLVYEKLRRLLQEELGVDPSGAVQEVYVRLLDR